jgi:ubiquinone/menaquinone biosynthesis C-methylase UbiE
MHQPNIGFMVSEGRKAKALKILKIISEANPPNYSHGHQPTLLDIGTGNGEIAHFLGEKYRVTSVDVTDHRQISDGFNFIEVSGESLPFSDKSFDVVVSNHIVEHVLSAEKHLAEIARIMRDDGLVYLATPNRLWPWEVHYHVPLLHYLPANLFLSLMKRFHRYHEDIDLMSWNALKQKTRHYFTLISYSDHICKWPENYYMGCPPAISKLLACVPLWVYRFFTFIHPTLIVILRKKP